MRPFARAPSNRDNQAGRWFGAIHHYHDDHRGNLVTGIAIAISTSGAAQTIAVVAASVLLLFLLSVGLSGEKRPVMKIVIVVAAVAAVMFTALAGLWPEPWLNWPLDLMSAGVAWLRPRWLATCIVVLLLVGWVLYPFLRLGRQRRVSRVARRVSSSSDG